MRISCQNEFMTTYLLLKGKACHSLAGVKLKLIEEMFEEVNRIVEQLLIINEILSFIS
ncbi:hypothetical protein SUSAZ_08950 [Sulfolobus acidocaldarius SUSAZ]|nr:hypothetical protein SUSAZ_08950 [Sulfolobus acidocaldarius SUSAZ]